MATPLGTIGCMLRPCGGHRSRINAKRRVCQETLTHPPFIVFDRTGVITYRGARLKRSTSCGHGHGEKPIHDGRSWLPFSRGNRACSRGDDCEAGMFFSFFCYYLIYYCFETYGREYPRLGCKITHKFRNNKELNDFSTPKLRFFAKL